MLAAIVGFFLLQDELSERLQWTTNSLVNAKKNGTPYRPRVFPVKSERFTSLSSK